MLKLVIKGGRSFKNSLNEHVLALDCLYFYLCISFNICFGVL